MPQADRPTALRACRRTNVASRELEPVALGNEANAPVGHEYVARVAYQVVTEQEHVSLGERVPTAAVLAAVAVLPRPVTLFVEGTSLAQQVKSLLARHAAAPGRTDVSGTIWPRSQRFHVSVTDPLMEELQPLAETLAEPEVADHLVAYDASGGVQLAAYDAGFDPIWAARDLPPSVLEQIAVLARS
jgi:hypothetical protein